MIENTIELRQNTILSDRYKVQTVLGMGGFGITYLAYDNLKNMPCAVKELCPNGVASRMADGFSMRAVSSDKEPAFEHSKDRFLEEAEILQSLNNVESVVSVYDFFLENGTCYFVMEYIEGMSLSQLIKRQGGSLPLDAVLEVVKKVGEALIKVHEQGLFHRDISPDNILLTYDGSVKLIDFGNAKNLVQKDGEVLSVVIKPGFAPPEQYSSKGKQGTFTDVYALAGTVYYALSGQKPQDVFERNKSGYRCLREYGFNDTISDAVEHAMQLKVSERTQTVKEFMTELGVYGQPSDKNTLPEVDERVGQQKRRIRPYVEILAGDNLGRKLFIEANANIKVGRNEHLAQIPFSDAHVSKIHCELFYDEIENNFFIMDKGSTNGTFIEGRRLQPETIEMIPAGTVITLGSADTVFKVGVI